MTFLHKTIFTVKLGSFEFRPGWIPSLATALMLYLLISLGLWQLERAKYKSYLEAKIETRQSLPPIALDQVPKNDAERLYLPVIANGFYDIEHQLLLDNRVVNMVAGYDVYTPIKLDNKTAILINRGWLPLGKSRQHLPEIKTPKDKVRVVGMLTVPPSPGISLAEDPDRYLKWPAVVQEIRFNDLEKVLGYKLYPMVIYLDGESDSVFHREPIKLNMKSEKHTGYAIQWFLLAVALVFIYLYVNIRRIKITHD